MKPYIAPAIKLTLIMIAICAVIYPLVIAAVGKMTPGKGKGVTVVVNGKVVGYERIGQKFTEDRYFWSRPSAVDYNAASSAGSNKGPSNPDYLKVVEQRIDTFLAHNPGIKKEEIPADLVTASGSGLDPHISREAAYVQVKRIATVRGIPETKVKALVDEHVTSPSVGPSTVHVLKLNIALDNLK